jgi:ubiquitin-protein ligase
MTTAPRIRRLTQDYQLLQKMFQNWPLIQITGTAGLPPEVYRFTYKIKGLFVSPSGDIMERDTHVLEVNLSLGYPRRAPQCRMLTPVFHPNFDDATVCIGDFWAASEGLDDLIVRIGRMIAYQEYNTKSPLNGLAAKWAAQNTHLLPVDARSIAPSLGKSQDESGPQDQNRTAAAEVAAKHPATPAGLPQATVPRQNGDQVTAPDRRPPEPEVKDPWSQKIVIS